jgi:hypothetical protein
VIRREGVEQTLREVAAEQLFETRSCRARHDSRPGRALARPLDVVLGAHGSCIDGARTRRDPWF